MNLLEDALAPSNVQAAWQHLRHDHAPWALDVPRENLEKDLPLHLTGLVDDLRTGRFRPQSLRQYSVRKGDGGTRIISAQFMRDKFAQRLIHQMLEPRIDPYLHPDSFGYRRGRGVHHAIARVRERINTGLNWLVDADIRSFFDRVPHSGIKKLLKNFVPDPRVRKLIDQWMILGAHRDSLLSARRGLPQGTIISPLLCNLYLHTLDEKLSQASIPFVRYADDFLLLTPSRASAEQSQQFAGKVLERLGLELHPDKTRVCRASANIKFLGEPVVRRRFWQRKAR